MRSYWNRELKKNAEDMRGFKDFSTCCEIDIMRCEEVLKERGLVLKEMFLRIYSFLPMSLINLNSPSMRGQN